MYHRNEDDFMKKSSGLIICVLLLAGCYTQFARREQALTDEYTPPDSVMSQDSMRAHLPDTLKVNNNQVCYWVQNVYGQPELRCDDENYGRDWYRYNNSPWWNSSSSYYYGDDNYNGSDEPCPAYYYYDNTCGACRYYRDCQGQRDWWWNSSARGSNSSSSGATTASSRARHSRTDGIPSGSLQAGGSTSEGQQKQAVSTGTGSASDISESGNTGAPAERTRHTRTDGIPSSEINDQQSANDAAARDMNKQIAPPQPQDVSPPPPPSQQNTSSQQQGAGQDNSSGSNSRDRHSTRGW
jgi:hypothetical protein